MTCQIISGLAEIADSYDAFIIDLWGVIHDGHTVYPGALETLKKLKELQKTTLLLSNSPRRRESSIALLESMGIARDLYTHIYTSGEDTHEGLKRRSHSWHQKLGANLYHIGPAIYEGIYAELPYEKKNVLEEADFILMTGAEWPRIKDYNALLEKAALLGLPMLCANPDQVVMRERQRVLCCGAVAHHYAQLGGEVHYHGKPNTAIYEPVFALLQDIMPKRTLAIGDSLATDIKGAQAAGIDSVLIMGGIHQAELQPCQSPDQALREDDLAITSLAISRRLGKLTAEANICPTYALNDLNWLNS